MVLPALCLTLIVFALVNLHPTRVKLAKEPSGARITEQQVEVWLDQNGFNRPFVVRYGEWLGGAVRGDFGHSSRFNAQVAEVLWPRLWLTAKLMFWVMVVMVPGALIIGVLAGMREGSAQDRILSAVAIDLHRVLVIVCERELVSALNCPADSQVDRVDHDEGACGFCLPGRVVD